jgi:hypothetical protein
MTHASVRERHDLERERLKMRRLLKVGCAMLLLTAFGTASRIEAAPIIFTDRDAFNLAAEPGAPLTITDVTLSTGLIHVTYGNMLPVVFDSEGLMHSNCTPNPLAKTCGSIPFGGGSLGASFTSVEPFVSPIKAVGYEVVGTFELFGRVIHATTPEFIGFVFDEPTTTMPLPQFVYIPDPMQPLPLQAPFNIQNVVVTALPEPATLLMFGSAAAVCLVRRRRRD